MKNYCIYCLQHRRKKREGVGVRTVVIGGIVVDTVVIGTVVGGGIVGSHCGARSLLFEERFHVLRCPTVREDSGWRKQNVCQKGGNTQKVQKMFTVVSGLKAASRTTF